MIIFDIQSQWLVLLYSLLVGAALGLIYDIFRISRLFMTLPSECTSVRYYRTLPRLKMFRASKQVTGDITAEPDALSIRINDFAVGIVAFFEDILFFCISAIALSVFVFNANTGQVRGFVLFGTLCGFILYLLTIGRATLFFGEVIVFIVRSVCSLIFTRLILPTIRTINKFFKFVYKSTIGKLHNKLKQRMSRRARVKRARQLYSFCSHIADYIIESDSNDLSKIENKHSTDHKRKKVG